MDTIQEFEAWSGIPVNTAKTKLMIIDGISSNRNVPTPNGNMRVSMDLVVERTLRSKETIQGHPLGPRQTVEVFAAKSVGNFRYLVTAP